MSMLPSHFVRGAAVAAIACATAVGCSTPTAPSTPAFTGRLDTPHENLPGRPFAVAVAPNGSIFVTQQDNQRVTRVGPALDAPRDHADVSVDPGDVLVTPDGATAIVSTFYGGKLHFLDAATGAQTDSTIIGPNAYRLALSADAASVFVTTVNGQVYRVSIATGEKADSVVLGGAIQGIARRADGRLAVSATNGTITLLDPASLDTIRTRAVLGGAQDLVFSKDGTRLFIAQEGAGRVKVLDGQTLADVDDVYFDALGAVSPFGLALSPDGATLLVASSDPAGVAAVRVSSLTAFHLEGFVGLGRRVAFAPDGRRAYVANEAGRLEVVR